MPLFAPDESIVVQSGIRARWMRSTGLMEVQRNAARFVCGEYQRGPGATV